MAKRRVSTKGKVAGRLKRRGMSKAKADRVAEKFVKNMKRRKQ